MLGTSLVFVEFQYGTDIYFARQLVFERLQDAREQIPAGVGTPEMGPNTSGLGQVFQYILRTEDPARFDTQALRSLNDWVVKQLLMPVEGVTDVLSFGGDVRQYQVQVDPKRLLAYGLAVPDLAGAIEDNNRNAGGWYVDRGAEQLVVRGVGWVRPGEDGLEDIGNIPLKIVDGVPVRVRDVANVAYGSEIRQGAVTMSTRDVNGEPRAMGEVVAGIVLKRMGANTKSTIDNISHRLPIIQTALPDGVSIDGGTPIVVSQLGERPMGMQWAEDGYIYIGRADEGIWRAPGSGGSHRRASGLGSWLMWGHCRHRPGQDGSAPEFSGQQGPQPAAQIGMAKARQKETQEGRREGAELQTPAGPAVDQEDRRTLCVPDPARERAGIAGHCAMGRVRAGHLDDRHYGSDAATRASAAPTGDRRSARIAASRHRECCGPPPRPSR